MTRESVKLTKQESRLGLKTDRLRCAYKRGSELHKGQKRKTGEPYFETHCVGVYEIVRNEWKIRDESTLIASLLHDTVEDTEYTVEQLRADFGESVANIVEGVTNLKGATDNENRKKVLNKSSIEVRVALAKLADRLHNMRTLGAMDPVRQQKKARETLDVYAPLAESLGMWEVKTELEDISYQYLNPQGYDKTKKLVDSDPRRQPAYIEETKTTIIDLLNEYKVRGKLRERLAGYLQIREKQKKMAIQARGTPESIEQVNDVLSIRIEVENILDCYKVLGIIHGRLGHRVDFERDDIFIGENARVNGYQAIQTTVNIKGKLVEIAIATTEMENYNRWGVITLLSKGERDLSRHSLKIVFTPTGKGKFLPNSATGLDLAATINPELLMTTTGKMIVDGVTRDIEDVIPQGSTVEICIDGSKWNLIERGVESCMPKTRYVFERLRIMEDRNKKTILGRQMMEAVLAPRGILDLNDLGDSIKHFLFLNGCRTVEDYYFIVGSEALSLTKVARDLEEMGVNKKTLGLTTVRVAGVDRPGILKAISQLVSCGEATIIRTVHQTQGTNFELRLVIKGLSEDKEVEIRKTLNNQNFYSRISVV